MNTKRLVGLIVAGLAVGLVIGVAAARHAASVRSAQARHAAEVLQYKRDAQEVSDSMKAFSEVLALKMILWRGTLADRLKDVDSSYQASFYQQFNEVWLKTYEKEPTEDDKASRETSTVDQKSANALLGTDKHLVEQRMKALADPPEEAKPIHEALLRLYQSYCSLEEFNKRPRDFLGWSKNVDSLISDLNRNHEQVAAVIGDLPPKKETNPSVPLIESSQTNERAGVQ